ncbi:MAG: histidine phosphatase family protein [bacterium]|nr:histidine phosphatase family protein [bacterium]
MRKIISVALLVFVFGTGWASAQEMDCDLPAAVIAVRHAEKIDESSDSPLTPRGWRQAVDLIDLLGARDIAAIYVTDRKRTRQTALPLAEFQDLNMIELPAGGEGTQELIRRLCSQHGGEVVMIVGHSNTLPQVFSAFGVTKSPQIGYADVYELEWFKNVPLVSRVMDSVVSP